MVSLLNLNNQCGRKKISLFLAITVAFATIIAATAVSICQIKLPHPVKIRLSGSKKLRYLLSSQIFLLVRQPATALIIQLM